MLKFLIHTLKINQGSELNETVEDEIQGIVGKHNGSGSLIPILQDIQEKYGYISKESVEVLSKELGVSESKIFGVATFYTQFRFQKPGKHQIKVCFGTACHVRDGEKIMDACERTLSIGHGETTEDGKYSLERVACMGCCALSPVMSVDEDIYGKISPTDVGKILEKYSSEGGQ